MSEYLLKFQKKWEKLCLKEKEFDNFTNQEKNWFNVQIFISSVENGGIASVFYSLPKQRIQDILYSLQVFELPNLIVLINNYIKLFSGKEIPDTAQKASDEMSVWDKKTLEIANQIDKEMVFLIETLEKKLHDYILIEKLDSES